ncbi:enoyl-CoA hydratase [soil metagenome]
MSEIDLRYEGAVAVLTLNAPERRNALNPQTAEDLIEAVETIDANPDIGAAVVQGAGGHFCAGADRKVLSGAGDDPADPDSYRDNGSVYGAFMRVGRCAVPTIAAVQGAAVGAGVNLMMANEMRVVGENARILAGFLRIGIHPGGGHYVLMGRTAGREAAAAAALFSEEISGRRAYELSMAWDCVPDDEVPTRALELAGRAAVDPELSRASVESFRMELGPPGISWEAGLQAERARQMWSLRRRTLRQES